MRIGLLLTAVILSFFVVSSLVRLVVWRSSQLAESDPYIQKIALAQSQSQPIDVLFIGASYVDVSIVPSVFDKEMAARGYRVHSFNLGIGGLGLVEMEAALRHVLGRDNCCKYVMFAPAFQLWNIAMAPDNISFIRFLDLRHAVEEFLYMISTPGVPNEGKPRSFYLGNLAATTFRHYSNLGLASNLLGLTSFSQAMRDWKTNPTYDAQGFTNLGPKLHDPGYSRSLANLLRYRAEYIARAASSNQPPAENWISPAMIDRITRLGHEIEATGAIPLVLIPPQVVYWDWNADFVVKFAQRCGDNRILDFSDPTVYPELYVDAARYDGGHLSGVGAPIWSRVLAERMAELLQNGKLTGKFCDDASR